MEELPSQFRYLQQVLDLPFVASDAEVTPNRVALLSAADAELFTRAYRTCSKEKELRSLVDWAADTGPADITRRVGRLTRVWEILGRDRIPGFDPESLVPSRELKADWSTLPQRLGYLVMAAEHWGNLPPLRSGASPVSREERSAFRELATRISNDRGAIDKWFRSAPIDIARARLSSLLILVEETEPDDERELVLVSPKKLCKMLRRLSSLTWTWRVPCDDLLREFGATLENRGGELWSARTVDGVKFWISVLPPMIRELQVPVQVFVGAPDREIERAKRSVEDELSKVWTLIRHIEGIRWHFGGGQAVVDVETLPSGDEAVLSIRLFPIDSPGNQ
jgi:hypothetical protein